MWLNPDLGKSSFDGENINSNHSSVFLLKVTIISYQWWYVAFSKHRMCKNNDCRWMREGWELVVANSAATNTLFTNTKQDNSWCHMFSVSNGRWTACLWDLHKLFNLSASFLLNEMNPKSYWLLPTLGVPMIRIFMNEVWLPYMNCLDIEVFISIEILKSIP